MNYVSAPKHIPMLFNKKMVTAILNGKKTATRRHVKDASKPPAKQGDLIWVREAFRLFRSFDECSCYDFPCRCPKDGTVLYRASHDTFDESRWKPSIHMPKSASRLTLLVKNVYADKLQNITEDQAIAEGMPDRSEAMKKAIDCGLGWYNDPVSLFSHTWNLIYGDWYSNPDVWVIEFDVIHQNIEEVRNGRS